jgi:hypothetical protein
MKCMSNFLFFDAAAFQYIYIIIITPYVSLSLNVMPHHREAPAKARSQIGLA